MKKTKMENSNQLMEKIMFLRGLKKKKNHVSYVSYKKNNKITIAC